MLDFDCGDNLFTITEIEVLHTLCSAPGQAVIFHITAFSHAAGGDDENLRSAGIFQCGIVVFITELFVDFLGGIFRFHDLFDTFGENRVPGVFRDCAIAGNDFHADDPVAFQFEFDTGYAACGSSHCTDIAALEAACHTLCGGEDDLIARFHEAGTDQIVTLFNRKRADADLAQMAELAKRSLLDDTAPGRHCDAELFVFFEHFLFDREHSTDLFVRFQLDQVDDRFAFAGSCAFGDLIDVQPVHDAAVREEEDQVVAVRIEQVFHMVLLLGLHADDADSAAMLGLIGVRRNAFDVSGVGDRNDTGVTRDKVGNVNIALVERDFGAPGIGVFVLDFLKFLFDDAEAEVAGRQKTAEIIRKFHFFVVFIFEVLNRQPGQLIESHIEDFRNLNLGESVFCDQCLLGFLTGPGGADDADDIVQIAHREQQTFQNMDPCFDFSKFKPGSAGDDFQTVVDIALENLKQIQGPRTVHVDDEHIAADRVFHLRVGVKLIENDGTHCAAFDVDDDPDADFMAGFVAQAGNAGDFLIADEVGDAFYEHFLVDRIRDFRDDDLLPAGFGFDDLRFCADFDNTMAGSIETADRINAVNDSGCRKVGAGNEFHQVGDGRGRIVEQMERAVDDFTEIVRRDIGRHSDADTGAAVDEQVREFCRQHFRFAFAFVEVRDHVDGIFVKVREEFLRKTLHPAFGVTGSRGGVAVDGSEIALTFDQRGAHGERLRKTDERIVNCGIAVRVIFTHDFTDDSRRFDGRMSFGKPQLFHSVENSAVYGFEPVADIRDGPSDIDTQ